MTIPFQDLLLTNADMMEAYVEAAARVIRSGRYINGPEVKAFEQEMCRLTGAAHCIAVSSGLDALRLILLGYKELGLLTDGDEVIVPANTFIATFLAVTSCGLTAVAAEVNEADFCLKLTHLPVSIRTRAILPVHLYGNPCWSKEVFSEFKKRGILVIEDAAQALGAAHSQEGFNGDRRAGNLGDAAAISFYPAKNVGAFGDAGAVLTSDSRLAEAVRKLANYGAEQKYVHELCGLNNRMDELQAAMLRLKLPKVAEVNADRLRKALLYDKAIKNPEVIKPRIATDGTLQAWHQYVVRHPRRDRLREYLLENGVATEIHYPVACHKQPCYQGNPLLKTYSPVPAAERLASEVLSLPIANVKDNEIERIAELINNFTVADL